MTTFFVIAGIATALFLTVRIIIVKRSRKPKTVRDLLNENPRFREMSNVFNALSELNVDGTDEDAIPDGYGEFGLEVTNPIPVKTVFGSISYLRKLQMLDGTKVTYERLGSARAPNNDNPIDLYEISANGQQITTLYVSPYNKRNSERAPNGFKLVGIFLKD